MTAPEELFFTPDEAANRLLAANPLALMIGMLLDQQVTMEFAFSAPRMLEQRLDEIGVPLDAAAIAARPSDEFEALFRRKPALHRFPGSMGQRTHALCVYLVEHHDGRAEAVWEDVDDGAELLARVEALPGFGTAKARIFVGVLGKRLGVTPPGWEEAAADWASIADVDTFARIGEIREAKRAMKAAQKQVKLAVVSSFVDEAQINAHAGDGGAGCMSFRREAHVPRGGPDGGDGGNGGDVWFSATRNMASLLAFRDHPHRKAESGTHGQGQKRHGKAADDLIVEVPEGTIVRDRNGTVLADLVHHGDRFLAARGGRGGRGNARFLSNRRRAPHFAEQGEYGEEQWLRLELKLMADAALVGFPNAGKSTLISAISAAKPKIADYPFTTLEPHLGVVRYRDHEFVVADIPGLIEGAAEGRGLGHRFLRHIERARVLVILLDLAATDERAPSEQLDVLLHELSSYRPDLLDRPRVVVLSKTDVVDADDIAAASGALGVDALAISAATHAGLDELLGALAQLVERARSEPAIDEQAPIMVLRPLEEGIVVEREGEHSWRVRGRAAERAVAVSDLTEPDAIAFVQDRLRRLGVDRALTRAAVGDGDTVRIAELEFEYHGDLL